MSKTTAHMHGHHKATMGLAGPSLGRELRARALSHTAPVLAWHRLRSQSPSRVQTATSHNKWSAASSPAALAYRACRQTCSWTCPPCRRRVARRARRGHPHRSSALDGAAAALTVACTRGVAVPLSWSWSHHPQGRAWADVLARVDTLGRTPYHLQVPSIYTRFNVPPLFIVPPPREREHVPTGSVPPSRLAASVITHGTGGNSRNYARNLPARRAAPHRQLRSVKRVFELLQKTLSRIRRCHCQCRGNGCAGKQRIRQGLEVCH